MGKIVKYCNSCDENFAEKFGFCPNCGAALQAFEMSPVLKTAVDKAAVVASTSTPEPPIPVIIAAPEPIAVVEPVVMETPAPIEAAYLLRQRPSMRTARRLTLKTNTADLPATVDFM